jgi:hypothetical protein
MKAAFNMSLALALAMLCVAGCSKNTVETVAAPVPKGMAWVAQGTNWAEEKAKLQTLGEQFENSGALYEKLRADAQGGQPLTWQQLSLPAFDWSGLYTRTSRGIQFDPDLGKGAGPDTAQLTPEGTAVLQKKRDQLARTGGGEYDPLSDCRPPGVPRWHTEPFLREAIVTPQQTWLINEQVNDVRRVYTDGREHTTDEDAYPSWNGDTIGFWDGDILVTHTKHLMSGQYQRGLQPDYSDQTTLVERWRKIDAKTIQADVWVFDPVNLAKPWYTRQSWSLVPNKDRAVRIRYWDCRENSNNSIVKQEDGSSEYKGFDFLQGSGTAAGGGAATKKSQQPAKR